MTTNERKKLTQEITTLLIKFGRKPVIEKAAVIVEAMELIYEIKPVNLRRVQNVMGM